MGIHLRCKHSAVLLDKSRTNGTIRHYDTAYSSYPASETSLGGVIQIGNPSAKYKQQNQRAAFPACVTPACMRVITLRPFIHEIISVVMCSGNNVQHPKPIRYERLDWYERQRETYIWATCFCLLVRMPVCVVTVRGWRIGLRARCKYRWICGRPVERACTGYETTKPHPTPQRQRSLLNHNHI